MPRKRVSPRRKQVRPRVSAPQPLAREPSAFEQMAKQALGAMLESAERDPEAFVKKAKDLVDKADATYRFFEENPNARAELGEKFARFRNEALSKVAGALRKKIA